MFATACVPARVGDLGIGRSGERAHDHAVRALAASMNVLTSEAFAGKMIAGSTDGAWGSSSDTGEPCCGSATSPSDAADRSVAGVEQSPLGGVVCVDGAS